MNHPKTRRKRRNGIETGGSKCPEKSRGEVGRLPRWCPAYRWRDPGPGSGMERGNQVPDTARSMVGESENSEWRKPLGGE